MYREKRSFEIRLPKVFACVFGHEIKTNTSIYLRFSLVMWHHIKKLWCNIHKDRTVRSRYVWVLKFVSGQNMKKHTVVSAI